MTFTLQHPRQQLVQIINRIYYGGLTTLSGGNLSTLDDEGNIWITPAGIDKGNLTPADMVCVQPDGTAIGLHPPSSELPFHRAIYAQRPDVRAVVHAHAPALVAFSIVRQIPDTRLIPQARRVCGHVGYAPYALPGSEILGANIAGTFAQGFDVVLLENHGVATSGSTLLEAFQRLETLDFCARTQLYAQTLGDISTLTDEQIALFDNWADHLPEFTPTYHSSHERELRHQMSDLVGRACERHLMISTEGVMSARVEGNTFLITPTGMDRRSIGYEDVVLIQNGQREQGKNPSRAVELHIKIYQCHPEVNCIITAQSPYATAYAIGLHPFDTKTIPESYILLQDVPKLPYGVQFTDRQVIAEAISEQHPVLLLQNDCVLTVGKNILQAFDRLEVVEFTARSLIYAVPIGSVVPIEERDIQALEKKFLQR
ncbi:MAG: class II aldolase/adducin family protein [Anaerolineae bacterium]|nr:class II aldolase/adducin family protein [Anaerolineae bacterium]